MSDAEQPRSAAPSVLDQVLELLERDARTAPERIAQALGRTEAEVREVIAQAERDRIILGYAALIDWARAGRADAWAWVELKVQPEPEVGFDGVAARIAGFPQTWSVYLTSGTYDIGVLVRGATMHEVSDFVSRKLAALAAVQSTVTHFIMRRYKVNGAEFGRDIEADRLPVSF